MPSYRTNRAIAAILAFALMTPWAGASGGKSWSIDVHKLGYRGDGARTVVRWWGPYVVVGSSKWIRDDQNQRCVFTLDQNKPVLVFDSASRKPAAKAVLETYKDTWQPPGAHKSAYPCTDETIFLSEGHTITPELTYAFDQHRFVVYLVQHDFWKVKYSIPTNDGCWTPCVVPNRTGTRFALLESGRSWETRMINSLDRVSDTFDTNKKIIRVFVSEDGKKLFERSWRITRNQAALDLADGETIAFSGDGEMLAILNEDGMLHVAGISDEK